MGITMAGNNKNSHLIWELASVFHTLVGGVAPQLVRRLHTHARTQLPQYEPFIRAADGWVGGGALLKLRPLEECLQPPAQQATHY